MTEDYQIHRIRSAEQIHLFGDEIRAAIKEILLDGEIQEKTVDSAYEEVLEHVKNPDNQAIWFALSSGELLGWAGVALHREARKICGVITWAWALPGVARNSVAEMYEEIERFAVNRGAGELFITRRSRLGGFERYLVRFGYSWHCSVFRKGLDDATTHQRVDRIGDGTSRDAGIRHPEGSFTAPTATVRCSGKESLRPSDHIAGDPDSDSPAAGDLRIPGRDAAPVEPGLRTRESTGHGRAPCKGRRRDSGRHTCGTGSAAVRERTDARGARPTVSAGILSIHPDGGGDSGHRTSEDSINEARTQGPGADRTTRAAGRKNRRTNRKTRSKRQGHKKGRKTTGESAEETRTQTDAL